jgi:hypothetical protein
MIVVRLTLLSAIALSAASCDYKPATHIDWKLEDDKRNVTATFRGYSSTLRLDVPGVEDLLTNLGIVRGSMLPEIPKFFKLGQRVTAVNDPAWVTEPDTEGNTLLHIRDPRYGWLHYLIPKEEARKLANYIQNQVSSPPLAPQ